MTATITISNRQIGVDHDGVISGSSIEEMVDSAETMLTQDGVMPCSAEGVRFLEAAIRSALRQASRPARFRSVSISNVLAQAAQIA